jgi:hypothetical protein
MNPFDDLDASIERVDRLADALEEQVTPCPASRLRLNAWLAEWTRSEQGLRATTQNLPELPQALRDDYAAWVHGGAK